MKPIATVPTAAFPSTPIAMIATCAEAGPKLGGGFPGVSGLDLGSGR